MCEREREREDRESAPLAERVSAKVLIEICNWASTSYKSSLISGLIRIFIV